MAAQRRGDARCWGISAIGSGRIEVYAAAVAALIPRTAPLHEALRTAGETDAGCAARWRSLVNRRAANMRLFAADLRSTGELRDDLTVEEVADVVWSTNAAEYWLPTGPAGLDAGAVRGSVGGPVKPDAAGLS